MTKMPNDFVSPKKSWHSWTGPKSSPDAPLTPDLDPVQVDFGWPLG